MFAQVHFLQDKSEISLNKILDDNNRSVKKAIFLQLSETGNFLGLNSGWTTAFSG